MLASDPFNDSVKELREVVVRAKLIEQQLTQKGVISSSSVEELRDAKETAEEMLHFLKEMLRVVDERGGKVQGKVFSANEIMERQNIVRSLEGDVAEARSFYEKIAASAAQRQRVAEAAVGSPGESCGVAADEFISAQVFAQREEEKVQDEVLERLTFGLRELRETGLHIHEELDTQEVMLDNVDRDISGVQVRLRAANAKVDKLLASMSNKGKVCTIAMLTFILVFLAFFGFG
ncbi:Qb-SNARE protein [Leishmania donovani]|uniref:Qb-SNARE_protein_-_putative n=3 Tax=Leishmania donovani species complex TaxID=38574 RepID=A0A6L0XML7_LEIIN|nr:putative syntaxin [Leishmania infantum JPCM5]XP_003860525.1 syntaxin, putative [Leishmania donovani]CAC9485306.1 Qb-SNARE_protein_-_putative [Leishmania infantum]AYU78470.1 Qb-SNARE protein, putative [Leishmania donovani]TPP49243.1 SNARE domain family protein [Leishmania donovani]TPP54773.1 SNARE domain family protein [Leishmania donovani]CAJ1988477.1 Qb-SNARE protein [Leishmania donovani]|eukprot:XP_001465505.1 putative syntaxin [Leishmania infantum JPCM5]